MPIDWTDKAADEIIDGVPIQVGDFRNSVRAWIAGSIKRHLPVSRCETCTYLILKESKLHCSYLNMPTNNDFGCVKWKEKA